MEHPGLFQLETAYRRAVERAQVKALEVIRDNPSLDPEETLRSFLEYELSLLGDSIPAMLQGCGLTTQILQSQLGPQCKVTSPSMTLDSSWYHGLGAVHEMKPGDSLWKIAKEQGVTVDQLYEWNPSLKELDERKIPIGTKVKIKPASPQEGLQSRPYMADIIVQCDPESLNDLAQNLGQYSSPDNAMPPPILLHPEFSSEGFSGQDPYREPSPPVPPNPFPADSPNDEDTSLDLPSIGSFLDYSMWTVNTSVGGMSTYLVYEGKYYKWNEFWHKTKTRGTAFRWQSRWNRGVAPAQRAKQVATVAKARNFSSKLTKVGGILIVADVALSGELKPSHAINALMLGASTTGVGAIAAGIWFIADFGTMGVNYLVNGEAKGIGDMVDERWGTLEIYEGAY